MSSAKMGHIKPEYYALHNPSSCAVPTGVVVQLFAFLISPLAVLLHY